MKKAIAIVLALLMALTPLGAFAPGEVIAEAETTGLVYGTDIPEFTTLGSRLNTEPYDCGNSHFEILYDMTGSEDPDSELDAYMVSLENAGFTLRQANTAGSSRSFTYFSGSEGEYDVVHCCYVGSSSYREFHIVYGPESYLGAASAGEVPAYDTVAEPSISIIGMSDSVACLVVQLADGSFVIIDGGYGYSAEGRSYSGSYYTRTMTYNRDHLADMEALYDFLAAKAPSGSKPQITWMITHADPDHITLPYVFMDKYSSGVDVNTVVCNFPADSLLEQWNVNTVSSGNSKVYAASFMSHFASADHFLYHTGQKLYLPGCEIEFLMTHEDLYPAVPTSCNHTSGAWRMTVGGKTILILGDCETELNNRMAEIYGSYLASDIVQPAHHGSNGGTEALYDLLKDDVKVCLWCCGDFPFYYDQRHTGEYSGFSFNAILRNAAGVSHYTNSATHTIKLSTLTEELGGGRLVTTGAYDGYRGTDVTYLSDKYGDTSVMVHASGYDSAKPFWVDQSFKANSLFLWNSSKAVSNVTSSKYPTGRTDVTTYAEANRTIFAKDIVLGYTGKYFSKGLGGHATSDRVDTSQVVFDIRNISGSMLHAVAGITGEAINKTDASKKYDLTFRIYGSMADAYSAASSFTLLSEVSGIEGYNKSANTAYNTAEFNVNISGWNYIKLECVSDGEAPGGAYAWGDVCLYTPMAANGTITSTDTFSGKSSDAIESTVTYLSSLTEKSSFVIGYQNKVDSPLTFYKDRSYPLRIKDAGHASDLDLLSFYAGSTTRLEIYTGQTGAAIQTDSEGVYRVSNNGVTYRPTTIALSFQGTVFEHGLSAIVGPANKKATSIVYDISGLNAQRFYSAVGITSRGNQDATGTYPYELTFSLYGSKTGTDDSDFELIAYVPAIRAWLAGEIDEDITGYKYLKLETSSDAAEDSKINWNNNYQFNSGFAWGDACIYNVSSKAENLGKAAVPAGIPKAAETSYLSDMYGTAARIASYIVPSSGSTPRDYKLDTNWDHDAAVPKTFAFNGKGSRYEISASKYDTGKDYRTLTVTDVNGTTSSIQYNTEEIILGYYGSKFEKGLAGLVSKNSGTPASVTFDLRGTDADRFYSVAGATGTLTDPNTNTYTLRFNVYGSRDGNSFELLSYAEGIRSYLIAEFDVSVKGYDYLKLETVSSANNNSGGSFVWADACVYKLKQPGISDNVGLVLHENLGVSCFADFADESADGAVMRFEYGEYTKDIPLPETAEVNGTYKFTYNGITPWTMGDEVTATLISGDGQELGSKTFSLKQLCQAYLDAESIDGYTNDQLAALKTLINDLLVYGGTLQTYTGYKTGSLVSDGIPASDRTINDPDMIDISGRTGSGVTVKSATIMHGNVNYLRVRFSLNGETSINDVAMNMTLGETTVPMNITNGGINEYYATSPGLMPTQYDDVLTVSASVNENDDASIVYSLNSYAYRMFNRENADNGVKALVKAMYNYGVSAEEYLRAINQ
ncbi:MAG: NPCBM/NEW2 domain-containing protein [Lachnospiraceae bacterium]|nr:NPCBM/NEW2 domain-containing protein [Lachnospiraceae bacterium]